MTFGEIFLVGVGLSMDAFAVSVVSGMCINCLNRRQALIIALAFGFFQGLMPLIGYFAGSVFADVVASFAPWIALVLLVLVGGKMIYESFGGEPEAIQSLSAKVLLMQAIATSIDALAIGVGFAAIRVEIVAAALIIACTTFVLSLIAIGVGKVFGGHLAGKAELLGGIILVIIGIKMVI